jgi:hypothetical protein
VSVEIAEPLRLLVAKIDSENRAVQDVERFSWLLVSTQKTVQRPATVERAVIEVLSKKRPLGA